MYEHLETAINIQRRYHDVKSVRILKHRNDGDKLLNQIHMITQHIYTHHWMMPNDTLKFIDCLADFDDLSAPLNSPLLKRFCTCRKENKSLTKKDYLKEITK